VVVEVKAAGINLMDTNVRRGFVPSFGLPLAVGVDGAGVVVGVGDQATAKVGDRVGTHSG
jgi:NADPH2:quinone reductase